jgi:hypothetical protein
MSEFLAELALSVSVAVEKAEQVSLVRFQRLDLLPRVVVQLLPLANLLLEANGLQRKMSTASEGRFLKGG